MYYKLLGPHPSSYSNPKHSGAAQSPISDAAASSEWKKAVLARRHFGARQTDPLYAELLNLKTYLQAFGRVCWSSYCRQ